MKKYLLLLFLMILLVQPIYATIGPETFWQVQSIDTMKMSRDLSLEKLHDTSFDTEIATQTELVAKTGANYIAIDTPYDEKFIPFLTRWVTEARKNNLHVWFRGNFSGWEGWFGTPKGMSFDDHIEKSRNFILNNSELFTDGDIFSSCPECENGAAGDPRQTGKIEEYRQFIIKETETNQKAFAQINRSVKTNYWPMNRDVAEQVWDADTSKKLGNIIVIDHYIKDPDQYPKDILKLAQKTNSTIVLGEIGAPIDDIHGKMTEEEQSAWMAQVLKSLATDKNLIGINYWTNKGGSTAMWDEENRPKKIVENITRFFTPGILNGKIFDQKGNPITGALIKGNYEQTISKDGNFQLMVVDDKSITASKDGFSTVFLNHTSPEVILYQTQQPWWQRLALFIRHEILHKK